MFISKATLNPHRRAAKHLLASPQRLHAAVLSAFAPSEIAHTGAGRVLWRADAREHHVDLIVVSPGMPDLIALVEEAGWPATAPAETKDYDRFLSRVARGSQWHFRVRANPVHSVRQPGSRTSRRLGHVTAEHQAQWWMSRAGAVGLRVIDPPAVFGDPVRAGDRVSVSERRTETFDRGGLGSDGRQRVTLTTAVFEGHAEVVDADLVRGALINGVGRARAYGCGLMTLVSVGS